MAYSNWGAFVHKNNRRRTDREDIAVYDDSEKDVPSGARIFVNLIRAREKHPEGGQPQHERSHHAVLGDGPIRLTGYKVYPRLYELTDDGQVVAVDLKPYATERDDYGVGTAWSGEYKGYRFAARQYDDGHSMLDLELDEPDGSQWRGKSGYCYGAGWDD